MRLGQLTRKLLQMAGDGLAAWIILGSPHSDTVLRRYALDMNRTRRYDLRKRLLTMETLGLLRLSDEEVTLTAKGKLLLDRSDLYSHTIKQVRWNGVWYLVSYDIPERLKKARDSFRGHLKSWGFLQIQDSLWVFPHDCKEDIAVLAHMLNIGQYVVYMNTDHLPMEKRLAVRFDLAEEYAKLHNF